MCKNREKKTSKIDRDRNLFIDCVKIIAYLCWRWLCGVRACFASFTSNFVYFLGDDNFLIYFNVTAGVLWVCVCVWLWLPKFKPLNCNRSYRHVGSTVCSVIFLFLSLQYCCFIHLLAFVFMQPMCWMPIFILLAFNLIHMIRMKINGYYVNGWARALKTNKIKHSHKSINNYKFYINVQ